MTVDLSTLAKAPDWTTFYVVPVRDADNETVCNVLRRNAVRALTNTAAVRGVRLGTARDLDEHPIVAVAGSDPAPDDADDESLPEIMYRDAEPDEQATHLQRWLALPQTSKPKTAPDDLMQARAQARLDKVLGVNSDGTPADRDDQSTWTPERWVQDARDIAESGTVFGIHPNHVLALLAALDAAASPAAAPAPAVSSPTLVETLADLINQPHEAQGQHRYVTDADCCTCGWPQVGPDAEWTATAPAIMRHISVAIAQEWVDLLSGAGHIAPPAPMLDENTPPDIRVGHCILCGQIMVQNTSTGDCWHPQGVLTPCPPPSEMSGEQQQPGRPGRYTFVHDGPRRAPEPDTTPDWMRPAPATEGTTP